MITRTSLTELVIVGISSRAVVLKRDCLRHLVFVMWPSNGVVVGQRTNPMSDVAIVDEGPIAAAVPASHVETLNVTKSSKVHVGTKVVSITQNVHNKEMLKGRFLGLDLVSTKHSRSLRCSVAVFVCWAFLVASCLILYLIYVALPGQQTRRDIELPLPQYLWHLVKNSSRTERLSCVFALLVLITCITLIVYFTCSKTKESGSPDKPPHEWNITRDMWLAKPYNYTSTTEKFSPLMLVIVQHTVSSSCTVFSQCAAELRNLQNWYIDYYKYDIPYNFFVGNDGRVYEGRGWNIEGAHTVLYNRCSLGLGFIGDYREEIPDHARVTEAQLNRTRMLLDEGVRLGYLRKDYQIVGASDLKPTASPGSNLYNAIKQWDNFDHQNRFKHLSCEQMQEKYGNVEL